MRTIYFIMSLLLTVFGLRAQVTSTPSPLQEDSQDVWIFFHADQGDKGLINQPASARLYAHTGVLTSKSGGAGDWKYAPTWGDNSPKYQLEYVSQNLWKLHIGDIRTYYGIKDPAEKIKRLAFVFRTADTSKEGKGPGHSDIFLDVLDSGLQVALESSLSGSLITPASAGNVSFSVGSTVDADLTLSVNGTKIADGRGRRLDAIYSFATFGDYTVEATATAGGKTERVSRRYCYARDAEAKPYPGGNPVPGAVRAADGSVTFCLTAPGKKSVILVGSWADYAVSNDYVMNYTDVDGIRYFWASVSGLDRTSAYPYYYIVDGDRSVGDPYARLVLDPYNDKYISKSVYPDLIPYPEDKVQNVMLGVYKENINDYDWKVKDFKGVAKDNLVIYELLLRDFTGTEGKSLGDGTVRGALDKLDYLKKLGVNAIELLPINEFNGNISWGYNPNFYFAPDKAYGTPRDYKDFIDMCHRMGIAVILDVVFNQADGLHPWYQMYDPGSNPFFNQTAPHAYSVLNDWNQGFPPVQRQWEDCLRYWMEEYKVDGFRFDLVKGLGDNDSYPDPGDSGTNRYNSSRVARMKQLHAVVRSVNPDAYFINENLAGEQEENEMAADGELNWANYNTPGCQFAMGYQSGSALNGMYAPKGGRTKGSTVSYLESHDEERLAYKQNNYGVAGVKGDRKASFRRLGSAAAQMLMAPGAHMIWQFSELGNSQTTKNSNGGNNTDPKKVDWAAFENSDAHGLYDSYRELNWIRNHNEDLFMESASFMSYCGDNDWNQGRRMISKAGDKELITVINPLTDRNITAFVTFSQKENSKYQIVSKSYDSSPVFDAAAGNVTVEPNCYVVIASNSVTGVDYICDDEEPTPDLSVYGDKGRIVVCRAVGGACVFDMSGRLCGLSGESGALDLQPGLYIVRGGRRTVKVIVR